LSWVYPYMPDLRFPALVGTLPGQGKLPGFPLGAGREAGEPVSGGE
jgi:hypothetical protein